MDDNTEVYVLTGTFEPQSQTGFVINFGQPGSLSTPVLPGHLDDLARTYYYASEYFAFAQSTLGWQPQLDLPLEYHVYSSRNGCFYDPSTQEIYIGADAYQSPGPNQPMNQEWHETAHYMMDDTIGWPPEAGGLNNHKGYVNDSTADSWAEGWAEFWPCALKFNRGDIDWYEYAHRSLEGNYRAWQNYRGSMATHTAARSWQSLAPPRPD